ncbi:GNAT family N-acetyltransferase [Kitasatospora sp. NPDC054939]
MDHDKALALFDEQLRREARPDGPQARIERTGTVVRQVGGAHVWQGVLWSDLASLNAAEVDAVIAEQVRHYGALGTDFEWKHYSHDRPADLADRLKAAGFTPEDPETVMVAGVEETVARLADTVVPEGVHLLPVTDEAGLDLVIEVHEKAFGTDGSRLRRRILAQLTDTPDTVTVVVAMAGDTPVSSARMDLCPGTGFAGLWGGGTVEAWRGRGLYRTLIAHRARIAAEHGYRYLQVDASDQSRPILERLGFAALTTTTPYLYG